MTSSPACPMDCRDWQPLDLQGQTLLDQGTDLELQRGQILAIIGPHRGHRRACLRALAGLQASQAQRMNICGLDLRAPGPAQLDLLHTRLGFVSTAFPLLVNLSVEANVMLPLSYHHRPSRAQARDTAHAVLDQIGFTGERTALPAFLSDRECLEAQLARCLIMHPQLLFIDEPFGLGTAEQWTESARRYAGLAQQFDCGVVVLTANISFASRHCDSILFVDEQRARSFASTDQLFDSEDAAVRQYLEQLQTWSHSR